MARNEYKSLGRNTLVLAFGTFGSKAISFFMLPVFTRVLTQQEFGKLDIISTLLSILLPILTIDITQALFRFTLDNSSLQRKRTVFSSTLAVIGGGYLLLVLFLPLFLSLGLSGPLLMVFYILFLFDAILGVSKTIIRAEEKLRLFAISNIIHTIVFAAFGILFVAVIKWGILGYFVSQIIATCIDIGILFSFGSVAKHVSFAAVTRSAVKEMASYSLPLIPNTLSLWIINASDRFLLILFLGLDAAGIYAVAHRFPQIMMIITSIFHQAWQISSISLFNSRGFQKEVFFSNVFRFFYVTVFLAVLVVSFFIRPISYWIVGETFAESILYIPVLMIAAIFQSFSGFFGVGYLASKRTKGALTTTVWGTLINVVLNLSLIPLIGIQAASISTAVSFLCIWLLRTKHSKKIMRIQINWRYFLSIALPSCFSMILVVLLEKPMIFQTALLFVVLLITRKDINKGLTYFSKSLANQLAKRRK